MNIAEFKQPTMPYRMASFWSWNDNLNTQELKRQIREMADKGWGGFFMHSRVGLVTKYLSKEWMEMIKACVEEARARGLLAWLYDEDRWPSGFAGGKVPLKNPAFRSRMLVLLDPCEVEEDDVPMMEFEINGEKKVICKRVSKLGDMWFNGTCYIDTMNSEAVKYFIECTHEEYKKECGEYFGNGIAGIFTDEPCYIRRSGIKQPILPWSEKLPSYFFEKKGYSIEEHLVELFYDVREYQKVRFDFYDCVSRLFLESYTKQYYEWCEKNGIRMTGHLVSEDTLVAQAGRIGAAMPHYEFMHWPGIDKLDRNIKQPVTIKQLSSVVEQLGKERALCEAFGCIGQHTSFFHRKWIADWMAVLGVNYICMHLSLYSMRGERKRDYPPNFFYQQPWWEHEKVFADYIARLCYAASKGKRDVNILVIHPIGSVWCEYSPLHKDTNFMRERELYDLPFAKLTDALIANKLDFHYGDEIIMEKHASIRGTKLVIGQHEYSTVIVPPALTLRRKTLALLKKFGEVAGYERLIFIKPYPTYVEGRREDISWIKDAQIVEGIPQAINRLAEMYPERIKVIDKMTGQNASSVICQQRSSAQGKWVLLVNTDNKREVNATVILPGLEIPYILDMFSGSVFQVPVEVVNNAVHIDMKFYPGGSVLLFYPASSESVRADNIPAVLATGICFKEIDSKRSKIVDNWDINLLEPNVLPLDKVTFYLDEKKVLENQHVSKAWDIFYKVQDGTPFCAEYTFDVIDVPSEPIFAVIEAADNLERILLNEHPLVPLKVKGEPNIFDPEKCWKDINFIKVPLDNYVQKGTNKLVLYGVKINNVNGPGTHVKVADSYNYVPTEVESVYLVGYFGVRIDGGKKFIIKHNKSPYFRNITRSGYPFYVGKVEFTQNIVIEKPIINNKVYIEIFDVRAASVELYVNGFFSGIRYWKPYVFEVSEFVKQGVNEIKIIVTTTLFNLMGPNWNADIMEIERVTPKSFVDFSRYTEDYILEPFGIGHMRISFL